MNDDNMNAGATEAAPEATPAQSPCAKSTPERTPGDTTEAMPESAGEAPQDPYTDAERALFDPKPLTQETQVAALHAAMEVLRGHGALKVTLVVVQQVNAKGVISSCIQKYSEEAAALAPCKTIGDLNKGTAITVFEIVSRSMPPMLRGILEGFFKSAKA